MSKGSRPRKSQVSKDKVGDNYDTIFGKKEKKEQYVPPPLPNMEVPKEPSPWDNSST